MVAAVTAGCSTGEPQLPDRGLQGEVEVDEAFWQEWTSGSPAAMEVDERLEPPTVFDVRFIDDPDFRNQAWDGVFHGLTSLHVAIDDREASRVIQSLMVRLDEDFEEVDWEIAFVSQGSGDAEGIVVRIVAPDGAGLWLEATRSAGGAQRPDRWIARLEPAARDVQGMTVQLEAGDDGWRLRRAPGAGAGEAGDRIDSDVDWSEIIALWETELWDQVAGTRYLEPDYTFDDTRRRPLSEGWPPALGDDVRERGLEDFVTDTVFPPASRDFEFDAP